MNIDDRRVRKTKKALQLSLMALMCEKDLNKITVRELVERADINRATFYAHYRDVFDLYEQTGRSLMEQLEVFMAASPSHDYSDIYRSVVDFILENAEIFRDLFAKGSNSSFLAELQSFCEERYKKICLYESGRQQLSEKQEYLIRYHISGLIFLLCRWAELNYQMPKETIVELIRQIDTSCDNLFDAAS